VTRNTVSHENLVNFGLRLKMIRATRGISQRWLAREAGLTSAAMSTIERGECCPTAMSLECLADVLGVTMDELWRGLRSDKYKK
jgi:transcriptional regulator with XRE-family HTH domain